MADINNKAVNVAGLKVIYNDLVDKIKNINTNKNDDITTDITINPDIETSLGNIRNRRIVRSETSNSLYWADPDESADGDVWKKTIIVKKKYSYPESIEDGTLVLTCAEKNKFKTVPYVDEQEDAANWYYRAFPISTNGGISNSALNKFNYWHYAVCIDEDNPIESESVTYLKGYDNENYKPLKVIMSNNNSNIDDNRCDWGDWKDAPFMPRPCMLKYDGTVDYYLNPDDYTLKENGEASDVSNTAYEGNAMIEFSPVFVKAKRVVTPASEDGQTPESSKLYLYFCSHKDDDDYECWSCKKEDGTYADHYYMAIYEATLINGKFRSLSTGNVATTDIRGGLTTCMNYARQCGEGWNIDLWSDWDLLRCLGILVTKRLNSQKTIGAGGTSYHEVPTGAGNKKGMFWGTLNYQNTYATKFFGIENPWSDIYRYCAGVIMNSDYSTILIKHTYSVVDGSTINGYNDSGAGYINTGLKIPTSSGYITKMQGNSQCITAPISTGGSDTTHLSDYMYRGGTGLCLGSRGGASVFGLFSWDSSHSPSVSGVDYGAALSFKNF